MAGSCDVVVCEWVRVLSCMSYKDEVGLSYV